MTPRDDLQALADALCDSLREGYLFGHRDEPLDAYGRRLVRVIELKLRALAAAQQMPQEPETSQFSEKEKAQALTYALALMRDRVTVEAPINAAAIQRHIYALIELVAQQTPAALDLSDSVEIVRPSLLPTPQDVIARSVETPAARPAEDTDQRASERLATIAERSAGLGLMKVPTTATPATHDRWFAERPSPTQAGHIQVVGPLSQQDAEAKVREWDCGHVWEDPREVAKRYSAALGAPTR